jgi:hypothetical protein
VKLGAKEVALEGADRWGIEETGAASKSDKFIPPSKALDSATALTPAGDGDRLLTALGHPLQAVIPG